MATLIAGARDDDMSRGLAVSTASGRVGGLILSGGTVSGSIVHSGGEELVEPGGVEIGGTLGSGGGPFIKSGGVASRTTVTGLEVVSSGGSRKGGHEMGSSGCRRRPSNHRNWLAACLGGGIRCRANGWRYSRGRLEVFTQMRKECPLFCALTYRKRLSCP